MQLCIPETLRSKLAALRFARSRDLIRPASAGLHPSPRDAGLRSKAPLRGTLDPRSVLLLIALVLPAACANPPPAETFGTLCETPRAPLLAVIPSGQTLVFGTTLGAEVVVASGSPDAPAPGDWQAGSALTLAPGDPYDIAVFAKVVDPRCDGVATGTFDAVYHVAPTLAPDAGDPASTAVPLDDRRIVAWATGWVAPLRFGADVSRSWRVPPTAALGPAGHDPVAVAVLGNGGVLTLTFDRPIADGPGPDLAVFENAIDPGFLELARVAVSSDGEAFATFDSIYLGETPLGPFDTHDPELIGGLAGKYPLGWGTPFDLALLRYAPAVQVGRVDLGHIRYVRILDVIGDGRERDSFGHPIYDPTPTVMTGGFDLDAIAVLHEAP